MSVLHGFEQTRQRRIDELDAALHEYIHTASGARLCWLEREDENKSFCAAFRTLPFDDTGVFHILEHSVLCGSGQRAVCRTDEGLLEHVPECTDVPGQDVLSRRQPQQPRFFESDARVS